MTAALAIVERRARPMPNDWLREHLDPLRDGTAPEPPPAEYGVSPLEHHEPNGLERSVGRLEARVDDLSNAVQALVSTWRVQEIRAVNDRQKLRDKMDETAAQVQQKFESVRKEIAEIKEQVAPLGDVVWEMKPRVDDYWNNRQRAIGVWLVLGILGTALVGTAAWVATHFSTIASHITGKSGTPWVP